MVRAFVMIKTGPGESEALLGDIQVLGSITEAHIVAGAYDIIAEVETDEVYEILETASTRIQEYSGVTDTKTYISLQE
jgi:DNA-binding Lrp family transcriptional regulator